MGHRQFGLCFRPALDAKSAKLANEVWNADPLALYVSPELRVHGATFELNDLMTQPLQILRHVSAANSSKGDLLEEAGVRLEGERRHADNLTQ